MIPLPDELLHSLASWQPVYAHLSALLQSPYPPRSIFVHAPSNLDVAAQLLAACMPATYGSDHSQADVDDIPHPSIQSLLPSAVFVDCAEVASTKALYGRVLNTLSGWGTGRWDDVYGGVVNWDGRQDGYRVTKDGQRSTPRLVWDLDSTPAPLASTNGALSTSRKDESLSGFLEGLRAVFDLGKTDSHPSTSQDPPRFIVLVNADRLSQIETIQAGQPEGMLLAVFMRIGELTGKPITPILVSSIDWLLLRPPRGATEPAAVIDIPSLGSKDISDFSYHTLVHTLSVPTINSTDAPERLHSALRLIISLLQPVFEPYYGDELSPYLFLIDKCWPEWYATFLRDGDDGYSPRVFSAFKPILTRELDLVAELRPLVSAPQAQDTQSHTASSSFEMAVSPSKRPTDNGVVEGIRSHADTHLQTPPQEKLAMSLPVIAKYLIIAAFLASANPSKTDILMLATAEDEFLASKRRKKKGGGTRKTPTKRADANRKEKLPQRLLGPKPFPIERLLAVCECILPVELRYLAHGPDILHQVATLTSLRFLTKTSMGATSSGLSGAASGGSFSAFDRLDNIKLKCNNLELELVETLGRSVGFKVAERLWEAL